MLKEQGYEINLLLIGDGPLRDVLENQASNLGIPAHFTGAVYDDKVVGKLISMSAVCVVPGRIDLTALDSLGFGTPVVTYDDYGSHGPEFEAIRDGHTGTFSNSDAERVNLNWTVNL